MRSRLDRSFVVMNVTRLLILVAFFGLWQLASQRKWINPLFIGEPTKMWEFARTNLTTKTFWRNEILVTMRESIYGFVIGSVIAVVVALVLSQLPRVERTVAPFFTLFNAMPKVGFAPLLTLWFGLGETSKVALVAMVVYFIVFVPVLAALSLVDPDLEIVSKTMGATRLQLFTKTSLPAIVPALFAALRLASVYSILVASFGEMLAAQRGLGQVLITRTNNFDIPAAFAVMIILAFLALAMNGMLGVLERRLLRWKSTNVTALSTAQ
jgi:NitT/TauT family transport system permease protein